MAHCCYHAPRVVAERLTEFTYAWREQFIAEMPSVLRKIFAKAGVTKNELRDRKTRAFIMNTLEVRATKNTNGERVF